MAGQSAGPVQQYVYDPKTRGYLKIGSPGTVQNGNGTWELAQPNTGRVDASGSSPVTVYPDQQQQQDPNSLSALRSTSTSVGQAAPAPVAFDANLLNEQLPPAPVYQPPAPLRVADRTEANAARYGAAKETQGQQTRASINALRNVMAASGRLGSGAETYGMTSIVGKGLEALSGVNRQNAIDDLGDVQDVSDKNFSAENAQAGTKYSGELTARGQDAGAISSRRSSLLELARMRASGAVY